MLPYVFLSFLFVSPASASSQALSVVHYPPLHASQLTPPGTLWVGIRNDASIPIEFVGAPEISMEFEYQSGAGSGTLPQILVHSACGVGAPRFLLLPGESFLRAVDVRPDYVGDVRVTFIAAVDVIGKDGRCGSLPLQVQETTNIRFGKQKNAKLDNPAKK